MSQEEKLKQLEPFITAVNQHIERIRISVKDSNCAVVNGKVIFNISSSEIRQHLDYIDQLAEQTNTICHY